jgi:protein gp37
MTKIEWTDRTWNPVTGCNKVSQGCKNCYAEVMHRRQMGMNPHKYTKPFLGGIEMHPDLLDEPKKWKKPCRVFVNSMSDLFHDAVNFEFILNAITVMESCPQHTFQILTKRPENIVKWAAWRREQNSYKPFPNNVWLGVSCEDQTTANARIPLLLQVPGPVTRFLSCEPLLGPIDLTGVQLPDEDSRYEINCLTDHDDEHFYNSHPKIDWVIAGGESGHHARPCHPKWIRSILEQCQVYDVPFFFKQWGEYLHVTECHEDMQFLYAAKDGFYKVGKKQAGYLLGRGYEHEEHREFPK